MLGSIPLPTLKKAKLLSMRINQMKFTLVIVSALFLVSNAVPQGQKANRGGTCTKSAEGGDQGGLNGIPVTPDALNCKDRKDSKCNSPGFAAFDDLPFGGKFITSPCTKDEECCTSCCDGKKCSAPDALKGAETCRNGLKPDFSSGSVQFVKA